MRLFVVLVAFGMFGVFGGLAGCDGVFGLGVPPSIDAGPGDLDAALPGDGADAALPGCAFTGDDFLLSGRWWSPSADLMSAVRYTDNGDVEYARVTGKTVTQLVETDYQLVLPPPIGQFGSPDHPVLAPGGNEMLVRMPRTGGSGNPFALGRSVRSTTLWAAPAEIALTDEDGQAFDLSIDQTLSGLTATMPRRMLIVGQGELRELIEGAPAAGWSVHRTYLPGVLGVSSFGSGSLSPDGLRMVFAGRPEPATLDRIYVTTRASVDEPFPQAAELYRSNLTPRAPYLAGACDELLFGSGFEVRRARR